MSRKKPLKGLLLALFSLLSFSYTQAIADAGIVPNPTDLAPISDVIKAEVDSGRISGAVVIVGNQDGIIYQQAEGNRAIKPEVLAMTADTVFDIASLTKPIATATAIMQLEEQGKLSLDDPVARYWPEFGTNGKEAITLRHLLTHYSGLRADLSMKNRWAGYETALLMIEAERSLAPPGQQFEYSDINFAILGELVRRISGESLDQYCATHIFVPLGMMDSGFLPAERQRPRIAPTEFMGGRLLQGEVHDPMASRMGGVAGHAGVFASAGDLSRFARMLLNSGSLDGVQLLKPETVAKMITPQSPAGKKVQRGLGWDINSPYAVSQGGTQFQVGSFGHTGYTGTAVWIDPKAKVFVIVLTNRVHPYGRGDVKPLRLKVASIVAYALAPQTVLASHEVAEQSVER